MFSSLQTVSCIAFLSMGSLQARQTKSEAEKGEAEGKGGLFGASPLIGQAQRAFWWHKTPEKLHAHFRTFRSNYS